MQTTHRTHFLFIEPEFEPTVEPIEDELTQMVDFIFSTLEVNGSFRGFHSTKYGISSDASNYKHPILPLISNSLAPYYIRHHRKDISSKILEWIPKLYNIVQDIDAYYYAIDTTKDVYYIRTYECSEMYGYYVTYLGKVIGTPEGIRYLLKDTFYDVLSEEEFLFDKQKATQDFYHETPNCSYAHAWVLEHNH